MKKLAVVGVALLFVSAVAIAAVPGGVSNISALLKIGTAPGTVPTCTIATTAGELCANGDIESASGNIKSSGTLAVGGAISLANAETISNASNGKIKLAGVGQTNNEDLSFDLETASNTCTLSSSTGVVLIDAGAIGYQTTAGVKSASLTTTTMEADLVAGACTAGVWKLDNAGGTRELCRCNDAGSAYDCISVTTANGPTN